MPDTIDANIFEWLTTCPATDGNFQVQLRNANAPTIREAIRHMQDKPNNKGRITALERRLRALGHTS
jgi:hypothetical protein